MKLQKIILLHILKMIGFFRIMRYISRHGVRILCYHGVWLGDEVFPGDAMFMNRRTFESRLDILRQWNFPVVPLSSAVACSKLPSCPVVITIDDGWFSTYSVMWPALVRQGMPATLYCDTAHLLSRQPVPHVMARYFRMMVEDGFTGQTHQLSLNTNIHYTMALKKEFETGIRLDEVTKFANDIAIDYDYYIRNKVFNYMLPEHLVEAYKGGLDVQLHTHNHTMHDLNNDALKREIDENRQQLSRILNVEPDNFSHFCYPSGVCSHDSGEVLDEMSILSSTTTSQSIAYLEKNHRQFLPRILDGEQLTTIEFEAELCGVMDLLRRIRRLVNHTMDND